MTAPIETVLPFAVAGLSASAATLLFVLARCAMSRDRVMRERLALSRRRAALALLARIASESVLRVEAFLRPDVGGSTADRHLTESEAAFLKHQAFDLTVTAMHAAAPGLVARAGITDPRHLVDIVDHLLETAVARHASESRARLPPAAYAAARPSAQA